jgi:uncharacterized membrane protein
MARGNKSNKLTRTPSQHISPSPQIAGKLSQQTAFHHEGPIPPPFILDGYEKVVPGAAERILAMAENQAGHRQKLESIAVKSGARDSLLGLIFGLIIGLFSVACGTYCVTKGYSIPGTILGGTGLVGLVGVFVYGSRQRSKERENKQKMIAQAK